MTVKYFKCMHCGNIIEKITDKGVPVMCCGEPMKELIAGKTDAAVPVESHLMALAAEEARITGQVVNLRGFANENK